MLVFETVNRLREWSAPLRAEGKTMGFVPTMGALHEGHASLVRRAKTENDLAVASVFVNPTQFDDPNDLAKYPRTVEHDIEKLLQAGCDVLFLPSVAEIYPRGTEVGIEVDLGGLDLVLEGAHRKGHFQGVVQVVHRLLDIVRPDHLYMGQKDFQQFAICKRMIEQTGLPVQIVRCPIVREPDGLAMSSRNVRLSAAGRAVAPRFYGALCGLAEALSHGRPVGEAVHETAQVLDSAPFSLDYLQVCDPDTLRDVEVLAPGQTVAVLATVRLDGVRLLDNLLVTADSSS
jgi:pantoate--beta-alanine ligase